MLHFSNVSCTLGIVLLLFSASVSLVCGEECDTDGEVRLVDGNLFNLGQVIVTESEGRIELCHNGEWGNICASNSWDEADAKVVCRQLNQSSGYAEPLSYLFDPLRSTPTHFSDVFCTGIESQIGNCLTTATNTFLCSTLNAGVKCHEAECNDTDIRMVDGQTPDDGRVEVCINGAWGSICDDYWDTRDARVACRQLGYDGLSYPLLRYGNNNPLVMHLDDVYCDGSEIKLTECDHRGFGVHNCLKGRDGAGVICTNATCEHGKVHLVGNNALSHGRVEYCYEGSWYSVCAEDFDEEGARVVCESLGHDTAFVSLLSKFGRGTRPILPKSIQCTTSDSKLSDCVTTDLEVSQCQQVAGVICKAYCLANGHTDCNQCINSNDCSLYPFCNCHPNCYTSGNCCPDVSHMENCVVSECKTGEIRLVGGETNSTGRLEFCANGQWGRLCNSFKYWGTDNAKVVCRQLGFSEDGAYVIDDTYAFGRSEQSFVLGEVHCIGTETELLQCSHSGLGLHTCSQFYLTPDITISCYNEKTSCEDGDVRLHHGTNPSNGHVEVCKYRTWGAVCSDEWDENDARVVCRQLSFDPEDARPMELFGTVPVTFQKVDCTGTETHLNMCTNALPTGLCNPVGVTCHKSSTPERCSDELGTPPDTQLIEYEEERFGVCEEYGVSSNEAYVCANVLHPGIDFVYISHTRGSQKDINSFLNDNIRDFDTTDDEDCVELVFRVICHYYLPPCGNSTHTTPPYTLCEDECVYVKSTCETTWWGAALVFGPDPFINCADTSRLLFPLPNCCTGAGITLRKPGTTSTLLPQNRSTTDSPSKPNSSISGGAIAGIVITIAIAVSVALVVVILLVKRYRRIHSRKLLERIQLDILARPADAQPVIESRIYEQAAIRSSRDIQEKRLILGESTADTNTYSLTQQLAATNTVSGSSMQAHERRTRIPSHYLRELTLGKFVVKQKDITMLDKIGEGEFGVVYKARLSRHVKHSKEVAVKTLKDCFDQMEVEMFVEESLKMSRFRHAHVMGLIGVCLDTDSAPFILMPYMANGSLLKYLKKEREKIVLLNNEDEDEVTAVCKRLAVMCSQIASGMEYLAAEKYIHRDLAARNCMIDAQYIIKITDFGLSEDVFVRNYFRQGSSEEVVKLPVKWMAPESLSDGHFSEKTDVWSYGVTMWEIFSGGKAPFPGTDPLTLIQRLEEGERMPKPYNSACSDEMYAMMRSCWEKAPEDRPTFKELYIQIIKYIEGIAGYLEMGFNPFSAEEGIENAPRDIGEEKERDGEGGKESGVESSVAFQQIPTSPQPKEEEALASVYIV